mgnify:CR=1 FL=1|jgi:hypothetical protein
MFEILKNTIQIEAGNKIYEIDPVMAEVNVNAARKKLIEFNDKLVMGEATEKDVKNIITAVVADLENVLGKGEIGIIFADKAISVHDVMDLVVYISAVAEDFERQKGDKYNVLRQNPFNSKRMN